MADADTSFYPKPNVQVSPMANPATILSMIGQLNQNKLFQQVYDSRQAVGDAYRDNTNEDGTQNAAGLMRDVGRSGFDAGAATGQAIQNTTADFQRRSAQTKFLMDATGTLASKPDLKPQDVFGLATSLARNTNIPTEMLTPLFSDLPNDQKALRQRLTTFQNAMTGSAGVAVPQTGTPDASGAPRAISTGAANYQLNTPQAPAGGATPAGAGMVVGNAPATEQVAGQRQRDLARATNYGQEIFPWQQALDKIQQLGPGGMGPGSKGRQEFQSFLYSMSPSIAQFAGVDPKKITNYAEAEKYLTNATQQRAAGMGAQNVLALETALTGSPNVHIPQMAAEDVTKMAIAMRRMEQVQTLQNAHVPLSAYPEQTAKWATSQDARAYAFDMMKPEQRAKLDKELKGPDRDKFNRSLMAAIQSGVISPPNAGQ